MRFTLRILTTVLVLAAVGWAGIAQAQVATVLIKEGDPLPGGAVDQLITAINNSAVDHSNGYAFTVNTSDGTTTLSNAWGHPSGGPGYLLRTEATIGIYEQNSWETFFGIGGAGQVAYSPICTNTETGSTGLDAVFLDDTMVMIEELPYPNEAGFWWSFGSRPGATEDGIPYWVGGITDTQGGTTINRGLFYGFGATPLLLGGQFVTGLPDPLSTSTTISFDYRFSAQGTHYIGEVQTVTGSTLNDNHMVIDGAVIMAGGMPVSENGTVPEEIGGLPGEAWDNFDFAGITEDGHYMFTGDTTAPTTEDEIIVVNGTIVYREGQVVDGETLSGAIEGAYMNENGDIAFIWDIQDNILEALYANDKLLLREGDPVDLDGDMIPDINAVVSDFTGISTLTLGDRGGDTNTRLYFTADVDIGPLQDGVLPDPADEPSDLEITGLEEFHSDANPASDTRELLECGIVLTVPTAVPVYLAEFKVLPEATAVALGWTVAFDGDADAFRLVARQDEREWEVPYQRTGPGVFAAHDDQAEPGAVTYTLFHRSGSDWMALDQRTVTVATPILATRLQGVYPNPFNPNTRIAFSVDNPQRVCITVFDMSGRLVTTLADQVYGTGTHQIEWNGLDRSGRGVASGTYLVTLDGDGAHDMQKIMLVQ
jgi:hypothetical protein